MAPIGLYAHVRRNDTRSALLFAGFVLAFHVLAGLALVVPLAMLDPDHAPLYGWSGYLVRWVPIVTVAGALLFAVQMAWHVRTVRGKTAFRFVDASDEPRLCRILEPLIIAAGLPTPYVGVIDSPAMNAFACGIRQKDAVLVFTRGLVDGLDDDELAAVAAHEITHILNGDIRLIAATNVCLDTLMILARRRPSKKANRVMETLAMPAIILLAPMLFVLVLVATYLRKKAVDASHLTRSLIASSREFIADAQALQLTQNPAALVAALRSIDGRSDLPGLAAGQNAMMIDGAASGAHATHPSIAARIEAIVATTGSLALVAPTRRDTRAPALAATKLFGWKDQPARRLPPRRTAKEAFPLNRFGLTDEMTAGIALAIAVFVCAHGWSVLDPKAMKAAFDPRPMRTIFDLAGKGASCELRGVMALTGRLKAMPIGCGSAEMERAFPRRGEKGGLMNTMGEAPAAGGDGTHEWPDGSFRSTLPPAAQIAQVQAERCYPTNPYSVGDRGLHQVGEAPDDTISIERWMGFGDAAAGNAIWASPADRDAALIAYVEQRKAHGETVHRFFGAPGLAIAQTHYDRPEHQAAVNLLAERLRDPRFGAHLSALDRAEMTLLATTPADFITCTARKERSQGTATPPPHV